MPQRFHQEVLTKEQVKLLPLLRKFSRSFGLVGGTAIALHLGQRRSIDFDLFSNRAFNNAAIRARISQTHGIQKTFKDELDQYTFFINGVQLTFFRYPYVLDYSEKFVDYCKMPNLLTLAAMKAFALGRRNKWKDYVDLYFRAYLKNPFWLQFQEFGCKRLIGIRRNTAITPSFRFGVFARIPEISPENYF